MSEKKHNMRVLYASFEAVPFTKLGGLGDVAGTLPMSIASHGCDIRVVIPYLSMIDEQYRNMLHFCGNYQIKMMGKDITYSLHMVRMRGVTFYLIGNEYYFDRPNAYGEKDDIERFTFFSRCLVDSMEHMDGFIPQILHCNDWHTSLANLYLREDYANRYDKYDIKTVFTIHNLQYQGKYNYDDVKDILELKSEKAKEAVMHDGKVNLMKCGISVSDAVTTPSPSYAKEILTYDYGEGLQSVLKKKKDVTFGILNGIDYVDFNPAWDVNIKVHFTKDLLERRIGDKIDLQRRFGLNEDTRAPLFCVACRFYEQKGIALVMDVVPKIVRNGGQILFLGDGDPKYKKQIKEFQEMYPGCVGSHLQFDPLLPHIVYAGADVLLMPSKFEPCGVAQMMAMHYGALPVVRSTGGLRDTVQNYAPKSLICNGFVFDKYNSKELDNALDVVFDVWRNDKKNWTRMQRRAMNKDFSWRASGKKYVVLYRALLSGDLDSFNEKLERDAVKEVTKVAKEAAKKARRHAKQNEEMAKLIQEEAREVVQHEQIEDPKKRREADKETIEKTNKKIKKKVKKDVSKTKKDLKKKAKKKKKEELKKNRKASIKHDVNAKKKAKKKKKNNKKKKGKKGKKSKK